MLAFAICDDSPADIKRIEDIVFQWSQERKHKNISVCSFSSPYALLDAVEKGECFDVFFLDILMPEMTGIVLGERLQDIVVKPLLIFLTNSEDFYPDAFRLYAFQYLRKPLEKTTVFPVLDKVLDYCTKQENDAFFLKTSSGLLRIPIDKIIYVELLSHICHVYLADGQHLESTYLRIGFDTFVQSLLQHRQFVKTHSSYAVNLKFVKKLSAGTILLTTDKEIPMTRGYSKSVQQRYVAYGLREEADFDA